MNKDYIIRLIREYNTHLKGADLEVPGFRREMHGELMKWLDRKQALAITGLRRTGKTTLMRQLIGDSGKRVAFFSFDEEETHSKDILVFVLDHMLGNLEPEMVFLDEVHYVRDWEGVLKRYYDQRGVKFVVSGSESMELERVKAPLAGRMATFRLDPLNFREYLGLAGAGDVPPGTDAGDHDALEALYHDFITRSEVLGEMFVEYVYKGAFPELVDEEDEEVIVRYIGDLVVKKIIFRDIPDIFEIRRRPLLHELFTYAASNTSGLFDLRNLANTLGCNYATAANYLFYLRSAFLLRVSETYTASMAKRIRRNKKLYVTHPSMALAALGYRRTMLVDQLMGPYVESVFATGTFWRDKRKNEVDVVIEGEVPIPVEVKYQGRISPSDLKGMLRFMEVFGVGKGIVVTRDLFERRKVGEKEVLCIPAWLFACTL